MAFISLLERTAMRILLPIVAALSLLQACNATSPHAYPSDRGQYQRGPISEAEAETLTSQLLDARAQRDSAMASMSSASNYEVRRKLQQSVHDYNQMIGLYESRLRSAGRPIPR
jgi:hypothetical protein